MVEEFAFDNADERRKVRHNGTGWIEVIAGSMFSGKSEELIRRLTRARIARQKVQVFKPGIDATLFGRGNCITLGPKTPFRPGRDYR